jgi:hypothetical protein
MKTRVTTTSLRVTSTPDPQVTSITDVCRLLTRAGGIRRLSGLFDRGGDSLGEHLGHDPHVCVREVAVSHHDVTPNDGASSYTTIVGSPQRGLAGGMVTDRYCGV